MDKLIIGLLVGASVAIVAMYLYFNRVFVIAF